MSQNRPNLQIKIDTLNLVYKLNPKLKDVVLRFLFVFNIFESEFFEEKNDKCVSERIEDIENFCNEKHLLLDELKSFHSHFKTIYIDNKDGKERFDTLCEFLGNKKKEYLKYFLEHTLDDKKNKEHSLKNALTLSYRFRNNLYHGTKDLTYLGDYKDDFEVITKFLKELMKHLDNNNAESV